MPSMEVWIEYASTYSYLTVARIGRLAAQIGVTLTGSPSSCRRSASNKASAFRFRKRRRRQHTCGATWSGARTSWVSRIDAPPPTL